METATPQPEGMVSDSHQSGVAFIDGQFVPINEAKIPLLDWGFLHSDATYDVAHVWQGRFFRLDDHMKRFAEGMQRLRMNLPWNLTEIRAILHECVRRSGLRDAYVEMICTRGQPAPGSRDPRTCDNQFYAFAIPFIWIADENAQERGLYANISQTERIPPSSVDPVIKNYHWLDFTVSLLDAYDQGSETTILVDRAGNVTEGPGFNIFMYKDGRLSTPKYGVLKGITRQTVIEIATDLGLPVQQIPIKAADLHQAEELFASSTAGGIMPITKLNGRKVASGSVGPQSCKIRDMYWQWHRDPRLNSPVDYTH